MTTLGQPAEASRPLGGVVPEGDAVVADAAVALTRAMTPANRRKKKLMPELILKPKDMTPKSTLREDVLRSEAEEEGKEVVLA